MCGAHQLREVGDDETDRPAATHEHGTTCHCVAGPLDRVDGDTGGLQKSADLQRGVVGQLDADVLRRGHVLGEHAVDVHADDAGSFAGVRVAGATGDALSADQVALQGDAVADAKPGHPAPDLHDGACALVPHRDGQVEVEGLGRRRPLVDLPVRAAQRRRGHLDDHTAVRGRRYTLTC